MDLAELNRLTTEFVDAVDELNAAARSAGQSDPGTPLDLGVASGPLRRRVTRVLSLQEDIVALLSDAPPEPMLQSVTTGLVVPASQWRTSPEEQAEWQQKARAALDRAAAQLDAVVVGEPEQTVVADGWGGVVITVTGRTRGR